MCSEIAYRALPSLKESFQKAKQVWLGTVKK